MRQRKISFWVILAIVFAGLLVFIGFIFLREDDKPNPVEELETATSTNVILTPSIKIENNPTIPPTITALSPLSDIEFPQDEINYPNIWPENIRFPEEFLLVEARSDYLQTDSTTIWTAKLRFKGEIETAENEITSFFISNGWQILDRTEEQSAGVIVIISKGDESNQGFIIIGSDASDPSNTNLFVSVPLD